MKKILLIILFPLLTAFSIFGKDPAPLKPLAPIEAKFYPRVLWSSQPTHGIKNSHLKMSMANVNKIIYLTDCDGCISAVNSESGKILWTKKIPYTLTSALGVSPYLLAVGTNEGEIVALNPVNGSTYWHNNLGSEILATPLIQKGRVFVKSIDGTLKALNAKTGKVLWTYEHKSPAFKLRASSSPKLSGELVVSGFSDGKLEALSYKTGQVVWESQIAAPESWMDIENLVDVDVDPVIDNDMIYVSSHQGVLSSVQLSSGRIMWQSNLSHYSGIALDNHYVYASDSKGVVWALHLDTGDLAWKQKGLESRDITSPLVLKDSLVVADEGGYVHWLNSHTGDFLARIKVHSLPIIAPPMALSGKLYIYVVNGELKALQQSR